MRAVTIAVVFTWGVTYPLAAAELPPLALGLGDNELALFDELPVVVSGSRRAGRLTESPVPINVATNDDIRLGGYTQVADVLMFQPGVDVVYADRTHPMIGIRGLHEIFSDRTLTLIDGVIAENPLYGGSELSRMPISVHDLAHIEVVRGPGGAAWGANAFNGVINLITARPDDLLGAHGRVHATHHGDTDASLRWGDFRGPFAWRMSFGYQDQVSSRSVTDDAESPDTDWRRSARTDGALTYHWTPTTEVTVGVGYAHLEEGALILLDLPNPNDVERDTIRAHAALRQEVTETAILTLRTFTNWYDSIDPTLLNARVLEHGGAAQVDVSDLGAHRLTVGSDARWTHIRQTNDEASTDNIFVLDANPTQEYRAGIFVIDRWQIAPSVAIESQGRADYYSGTGSDWAGRLAGLITLDEETQQLLRLAVARAYRTPLASLRSVSLDTAFIAPDTPLITYRSQDLDNEQTFSVELGWSGALWDGGLLRVDSYWQRYTDLIGYDTTLTPTGFPGVDFVAIVPTTLGAADGYGGEIELTQSHAWGRIAVWYAWNAFETEASGTSVRAFEPAEHKTGVRSRWKLPAHLTGIINYRYASEHEAPGANRVVTAAHRLDITLSRTWSFAALETLIGVHDVFDQTPDGVAIFTARPQPLPGRTAFLQVSGSF